jgi:hypothetical protein
MFNSHADLPASASPRVKDFDTGFPPTFVDVGYNLGGAIIAEDFMVHQLWEAKKVVCFPKLAFPCVLTMSFSYIASHDRRLVSRPALHKIKG